MVVKATLLHPAQLPLILGPFGQASSSCRLRVLHLAFLETKCTAPGGLQSSGNPRNEEVARSAWSAILGCVHLQELNISRTNMLPLTDGVMSQLPEKLPMLEVLQYNGYLDVQGPGYHHLARLPLLSTLAMGSNQAPGSPSQTEFHLQLWQLPQQLQCLSLLNAVMHSHPGGIAGFPPGLRQLSLKFCRLVNSLNAHDSSQGAQKASDTCRCVLDFYLNLLAYFCARCTSSKQVSSIAQDLHDESCMHSFLFFSESNVFEPILKRCFLLKPRRVLHGVQDVQSDLPPSEPDEPAHLRSQ